MKKMKIMPAKIKFFKLLKLAEDQQCFELEQRGDKAILKFWPSFLDDLPEDIVVFSITFKIEGEDAILEDLSIITEQGTFSINLDVCCNAIQAWLDTINLCYL